GLRAERFAHGPHARPDVRRRHVRLPAAGDATRAVGRERRLPDVRGALPGATRAVSGSDGPLSSREFRRACGHFLTGVTIVTARAADGAPAGLTVNSFTSVSLEPPLVLVCVDRRSATYPAFVQGSHSAVHVLRLDPRELSTRFELPPAGRLAGIAM